MDTEELQYLIALKQIPNIGDATAKKLIQHFGSAKAVYHAKTKDLLDVNGIGNKKLKQFRDSSYLKLAEEEIKFIAQENIKVTYFKDTDYPKHLKHCIDSPIILFEKGNIDLQNKHLISIVGTRQITSSGIQFCEELIEKLAPLNPVIISGFAYGADICAHKKCIDLNLQTIAVLAHGFNTIYPKLHKRYQADMYNNGGFMTDFCSYQNFDRNNFLGRNRIIAGLSEATIVIESAEKGGSLVTADIANSYNREVFAVPGRPTDKFSKGCNNLIKRHQAHVLTQPEDIIYLLNWDIKQKVKPIQVELFEALTPQEEKCLEMLKTTTKAELDEICRLTQLPSYKTVSILLNLELKGLVRPLPGKLFEIITH